MTGILAMTDNMVAREGAIPNRTRVSLVVRSFLMRKVLIAVTGLAVSGLACVSNDVAESYTAPYPVYRVTPPARLHRSAVARQQIALPSARETVPRQWYPAKRPINPKWTTIVLHHSATEVGGARRFDKHHREGNGWDELGYHFVIGNGTDTPDGYVEAGPRWYKQKHGAHCKTPNNYFNEHGIGICLVGDFTKTTPTPRQMAATQKLLRFLTRACRIPPSRITTHRAATHKTQCPGPNFPLLALQRSLSSTSVAANLP